MGARESKSGLSACRFHGQAAIHAATEAARAFAAGESLARDDAAHLCIVIEELVTNLLDHGGVGPDQDIELALRHDAGSIAIILTDPGTPFDPRTAILPDGPNAERGGGAGLDLVRAWTQIVRYASRDGRNRLELVLPISAV